ncbi:hypothetical protein JNB_09979 [Janibacter sp. HTCC2649]|uniref:hypothetical protein n=1 Tax=Janibacter sp. HTCC2649 TaxID=313589 RepID=UPI0000670968|nr:hypothetical protein [Janibacter sp. HTCC2649]EAQ00493.1 hypothetical protein JNB_09979 [Janibacter sp. HTCC2649]
MQGARDEAAKAAAAAATGKPVPRWEYKTHINCATGNTNPDAGCGTAAQACTNGQFQAVVLRRLMVPVQRTNAPAPLPSGSSTGPGSAVPVPGGSTMAPAPGAQGQWHVWGVTCYPQLLPGNALPTMAQVLKAFREIDFAKGDVSIQPVGNVTLVNLPTYFAATWPQAGVGPDESDVTNLLGYRLEIQPLARSLTYVYGDGNSSGPTTSLGGPHPDGDIRWTYKRPGTMATRVDTFYGGRFRFGTGAWMTIPETVTVQGTPVNLTVREAKARLYNNG